MRYGMVIDLSRCIGCQACTVACKQKNGTPPGVLYSQVIIEESGTYPNGRLRPLPILCNHCDKPPCDRVCPTGATQQQRNGIVTVNQEKCIGCRECMIACPYNARHFNLSKVSPQYEGKDFTPFEKARKNEHKTGTVGKCDLCKARVAAKQKPKCAETCPAKARIFGDLDDPKSEVAQLIAKHNAKPLKPEFGTKPSVYYLPI